MHQKQNSLRSTDMALNHIEIPKDLKLKIIKSIKKEEKKLYYKRISSYSFTGVLSLSLFFYSISAFSDIAKETGFYDFFSFIFYSDSIVMTKEFILALTETLPTISLISGVLGLALVMWSGLQTLKIYKNYGNLEKNKFIKA